MKKIDGGRSVEEKARSLVKRERQIGRIGIGKASQYCIFSTPLF